LFRIATTNLPKIRINNSLINSVCAAKGYNGKIGPAGLGVGKIYKNKIKYSQILINICIYLIKKSVLLMPTFAAIFWCGTASARQDGVQIAPPASDLIVSVQSIAARTVVPPEVIESTLSLDDGLSRLRDYFDNPLPDRVETTGRGFAVINKLIASSRVSDLNQEQLYAGVRRARDVGIGSIFSVPVSRLVISDDFIPTLDSYVWDFGSSDSRIATGFNLLSAGDPGVAGFLEPYARLGAHMLSGDGLVGVREFKTEIGNGRWRVTLIGDAPMTGDNRPAFGGEIVANGVSILVDDTGPNGWLPGAVMGQGGTGDSNGEDFQQTNQAVVVQFEVDVLDGLMTLQFVDDAAISGVIIEPNDQPASAVFKDWAANAPLLIGEALALAAALDARLWDFPNQGEFLIRQAKFPPPVGPIEATLSP
jgi:hypothetical protein